MLSCWCKQLSASFLLKGCCFVYYYRWKKGVHTNIVERGWSGVNEHSIAVQFGLSICLEYGECSFAPTTFHTRGVDNGASTLEYRLWRLIAELASLALLQPITT
jgi:hypothetical protein